MRAIVTAPAVRRCLTEASSCDEVMSCLNDGEPSGECDPSRDPVSCSGTVIRACLKVGETQGRQVAFDCALQGNGCVDGGGGLFGCTTETCTDEFGCIDEQTGNQCRGDLNWRNVCPLDMRCEFSSDPHRPSVYCVDRGPRASCRDDRCEDGQLLRCGTHGYVRTMCAPDTTCRTVGGGEAFCGVASDCSPDERERCDGTAIEACVLGQRIRLDCVSLGFERCVENRRAATVRCE